MTASVTPRDFLPNRNGRGAEVDSPSASARARAKIPVTVRSGKIGSVGVSLKRAGARWWAWTGRPLSLRASWRLSAVDPKRIVGGSKVWAAVWHVSNWTDRLLMFVVVLAAPTFMQGPLRWIAARPTRRWGFYLTAAVLTVVAVIAFGHRAGKG